MGLLTPTRISFHNDEASKFPWATPASFVWDESLLLFLPLWAGDLNGSTVLSKDHKLRLTSTVTGAVWGVEGRTFDPTDDDITLPSSPAIINLNRNFTFECWIKLAGASTAYPSILTSGNSGFSLGIDVALQAFRFFHTGAVLLAGTSAFSFNTWYHLVGGVGTGATAPYYMWVNSSQVVSDTTNLDFVSGTAPMIGRDDSSVSINGIIREVRIYSRLLTQAEVTQNYLATKGGVGL